jgi:site-specific recombinase XerD
MFIGRTSRRVTGRWVGNLFSWFTAGTPRSPHHGNPSGNASATVTAFVFASRIGTALDARNVVRRYHVVRELAGLPNLPWHHLRHCAATALLEAGEDLFIVSRILGHTSVATTASFYGHVRPAMLRRSAERMVELLNGAAGT